MQPTNQRGQFMNVAHIMLQAKGGAGKTTCCVHLSQYLKEQHLENLLPKQRLEKKLRIYDTDPSNQSLAVYQDLNVDIVNVLDADENIDKAKFDRVFNAFLEGEHDIVMDTGSSNFHAFVSYMKINDIVKVANEFGKHVIFHVPINHDSAYLDTCQSLDKICKSFKNANIIVWSNVYTTKKDKVKDFTQTDAYAENENILGVVTLRGMDSDTEFNDFSQMLKEHLTYDEVKLSDDFTFLQKNRLSKIYQEIKQELDSVLKPTQDDSE